MHAPCLEIAMHGEIGRERQVAGAHDYAQVVETRLPGPAVMLAVRGHQAGDALIFHFDSYQQRCHLSPVIPAVGTALPDMQRVPDTFGIKYVAEETVVVQERVGGADGHDDVHAP